MSGRILFITSNSLSTNPRLLKEIKLALKMGFVAELLSFRLGNWSDGTDDKHFKDLQEINNILLSAKKYPFLPWLFSTMVLKMCNLLYPLLKNNLKINAYAHNKRTWLINNALKKNKGKFELIVAHNLGALYPAYRYSNKYKIPFIFDIEDYHPGEKCSPDEKKRRELLMKKMLPKAACLTYASPLIGKYTLELLNNSQIKEITPAPSPFWRGRGERHILINNCFSENEFVLTENNSGKIQMLWFSQNIAAGRGLELVLPALYKFKNQVQLNLIGNLYRQFYDDFLYQYEEILNIMEPMAQADLHKCICGFDIGLAIEQKASDFNRDICLTNKIFAYAQAGLYILATDTSAQKQFIHENPLLGQIVGQNEAEMEEAIANMVQNIGKIRAAKKNRFEYANKLGWENESRKLTAIWDEILKNC